MGHDAQAEDGEPDHSTNRYFPVFEIPVYRRTVHEHADYERRRWQRAIGDELVTMGASDSFMERSWERWVRYDAIPWKYNTIIGWIQLHADGARIKGDYWTAHYQRWRRRSVMGRSGRLLELLVPESGTDAEITRQLLERLTDAQSTGPFKGKNVDLSSFESTAPHIRWRELLGLERPKEVRPFR